MKHPGSFDTHDSGSYRAFTNPQIIEKDLQTLIGILNGIKADSVIGSVEQSGLHNWLNAYKDYEDKQPYKEVITFIRSALADNVLTIEEIENIIWYCNHYVKRSGYYDELTAGIQKLSGLIKGITIDGVVNPEEILFLDNWLEENRHLANTYPYDEVYSMTVNILRDKVITPEEQVEFLKFSSALVGLSENDGNSNLVESLNTGFYQVDPQITIQENTFCITGESKQFSRREIAERIELYGGFVVDHISGKLNYLVVCDEKNKCWAFTCYGRKVEQVIKLRKKGVNVAIVHEFDLNDTLEDL